MDGYAWPHHTRLGDLDAATARALDHPDTPVAEAAGAYAAAFAVWTGALMAGLLRLCAQVAAGTGGPDAAPTLKAMATRMVAECDSQEEALLGFAKRALAAIPLPPPHPSADPALTSVVISEAARLGRVIRAVTDVYDPVAATRKAAAAAVAFAERHGAD